uniref:Uncharacterized protein n=1 Tax=viral metagenome TaxID=1070528 RepID=A0A6H2A1F1_9ZZZZ
MKAKTAAEFWEERFKELPRTDTEKLAVAMMTEYADYVCNKQTIYICGKCQKEMKYWNGCKMGAYGVDIENCEDPQYKCICGNKFYIMQ